ncbi:MAG: ester cyclase [Candidatus Aminicenantes bacterium]|nr:ester cyclase [Candidatus Aminicenantes bacterium]NTV81391.1 ester cyclase [Candidatus Aminicenantes bacterium]
MFRTLGVVLLTVIVGIAAGCGDQAKDQAAEAALAEVQAAKARSELEARNVELVRTIVAQLEKGDVDVIQRLFAPDFKLYFPSNSATPVSREDAMGVAKMMVTAVPDLAYGILEIFGADDRVVLRLVMKGTHRVAAGGGPPKETAIEAGAMIIFRVKEGLVVEEVVDGDALGLFRQLGLELQPRAKAK